ncbi:MAG: tRNA (adenosine(37)-N6)-threonylcarbamoyltransferase complex ATPase subunit type 1 TsaE [Puniceicoccales bacterium]|jgi:tRNA threonylcarbamoyladenosine biosynthesis protein TsaE|nr:tRNA (adenosine(37)-N6)-threonylcarbamoyltransferase complex ATPase subunit type 1 TsaE [Puniceicoccales bacterium]
MDVINRFLSGYESNSIEETIEAGRIFGSIIAENSVVSMRGDLGAGKTTFVKGIAEFFDISDNITSPTFNIFSLYSGRINLLHVDAYRLNDPKEAEDIALEDFLIPPFLMLVEWPENLGLLNDCDYLLNFSLGPDCHRTITLEIDETSLQCSIN